MQPSDTKHIPALDGLRGVAVLLVLFYHFTMFGRLWFLAPQVRGWQSVVASKIAYVAMSGWIGVDLFFVLSGYLITTILLNQKGNPRFFRNFYGRRAARILPLYYAYLGGYAAYVFCFGAHPQLGSLRWPLLFGTNIALGVFGDAALPHELQHLWSLAIEEQFYLLFPLLIVALSRRELRWVCALGMVVALAFRVLVWQSVPLCQFLTPARWDGLLVGAAVASVLSGPTAGEQGASVQRLTRILLVVTSAVLASLVIWRGSLASGDPVIDLYGLTPLTAFFGAIVAGCVTLRGSVLARCLSLSPLRFFGRYSYAMYVLHMPVLAGMFALHLGIRSLAVASGSLLIGYALFVALAGSGTVLAALVSYYALERHFLALRSRLRQESPRAEELPV